MNKNKKYGLLFKNTLIFAIGSLGSKLITFFLVPLYTNVLTKSEYGTADLISTIANIMVPVCGLVIQDAVLRFGLSKDYNKASVIKNAFILFLPGALLCLAITPFFGLYPAVSEWGLYIFAISISTMLYNIVFNYAKAKDMNKLYAFGSILSTLILAISNILLLLVFKSGIQGYLISNTLCLLLPSLVLLVATKSISDSLKAPYSKDLLVEMIKYSAPLIANNLSWWILSSSDKVMIEFFLSKDDLGLYTAASKIPALLSIVTTIFASAWTISSIKEYDDDGEKDKSFYSNVFKFFSLLMFSVALAILLVLKPFMSIYVGKEFFESWVFVPFLILGTVFYSFGSFFGAIFRALKKNVSCTITTVIAGIVNIVINLLLIPVIGVFAATLSTAISYLLIDIIRMLYSRKFFKFEIDFIKFIINSAILIVASILIILEPNFIYLISGIGLVLILIVNLKDYRGLVTFIITILKKRKIQVNGGESDVE